MLNRTTIHAAAAVLAIFFSAALNNRAQAAFANGDFITYWQNSWGELPNGSNVGQLLESNYNAVYPLGTVDFGLPGQSMTFTGPDKVIAYLPASGAPGPLTGINDNPTSTSSGSFGGDVVALRLNIDYADAGVIDGASPTRFGDLLLFDFPALPLLENMSIRELFVHANSRLGGGPGVYGIDTLSPLLDALNFAFQDGVVDQFAQDHLRIVPEPSTSGLALLALLALASRRNRVAAGSVLSSNLELGRNPC